MPQKHKKTQSIARVAVISALLLVSHVVLVALPNVELVTVVLISIAAFSLREAIAVAIVYSMVTGLIYGFGIWWVSYLYIWPLLAICSSIFLRSNIESLARAVALATVFGAVFGILTALPYLFVDTSYFITYILNGIPFDIIHTISCFATTLIFYKPLINLFRRFQYK